MVTELNDEALLIEALKREAAARLKAEAHILSLQDYIDRIPYSDEWEQMLDRLTLLEEENAQLRVQVTGEPE